MSMKSCGREIAGLPCCTVIHGDCEDYIGAFSAGCVDLVVTDPPYGMNYVSHRRAVLYDAITNDDRLPTETMQGLIALPRLASYFFCRWQNLWEHAALPKPNSVITWVKNNHGSGDLFHAHAPQTEVALFYPGPAHRFKHRPSDVLDARKTGNAIHSTQKPVELIKQMLSWYDFDTVLDPYMGSGTTGRAAKELGKHFLGFEIDEKYWRDACTRIENSQDAINRTLEIAMCAGTDSQPGLFGAAQ